MDEDAFWKLIKTAKAEAAPPEVDQAECLCQSLMKLTSTEILAFNRVFARLVDDACRWDLWAAGYIITKGFDRDGFLDFRVGLVALGREVYSAALADPNTLGQLVGIEVDFVGARVLLAAPGAYESVMGEGMPPPCASRSPSRRRAAP